MLRWLRARKGEADQAMRTLGDAVGRACPDGTSALYLEATAAEIDMVLLCQGEDGTIQRFAPEAEVGLYAREAWNQFRLLDRPIWKAVQLQVAPGNLQSITYIYDSQFDDCANFQRRSRRWAMAQFGRAGVVATAWSKY